MGYTQEQLAEIMCIPKSTISAYENDKVDIKSSVIVELAGVLKTDANDLLGTGKAEREELQEMTRLLGKISDEKVMEILMKQIRAVVK